MVNLIRAELRKLLGLRTAWLGLALGLVASPALVVVSAGYTRRSLAAGSYGDVSDLSFQTLMVAVLGATVLGVVTVSSELTSTGEDSPDGRQLTTTLLAMPRRGRLLLAKGVALSLVVAVQGAVTTAATLALVRVVHGAVVPAPAPGRAVAAVFYLVLIGLLSYALTLIFRNGVITLTILILNSSVVSVSYLLTKLTPAAAYLPDIVGPHMFLRSIGDLHIPPVRAGFVMVAWVVALLALGAWLFRRRAA